MNFLELSEFQQWCIVHMLPSEIFPIEDLSTLEITVNGVSANLMQTIEYLEEAFYEEVERRAYYRLQSKINDAELSLSELRSDLADLIKTIDKLKEKQDDRH